MNVLRLQAYGKINLALDVLRRREDGYHEVSMIMQTVKLHDNIDLQRVSEPGIQIQTNLSFLPVNENNLMYRAARMLMDEFSIQDGILMKLRKLIPVSAGMAGGSSDAAAVLYGMNRLFSLGLSIRELQARGVHLGADVPFCLLRGTWLSEGIGEILHPLPPVPDCAIVLAKPAVSVSTKSVYAQLHVDSLPREAHPDVAGTIDALQAGSLEGIAARMGNILETVTCREHPVIETIKERMKEMGALCALMTGSGPTVFGLFTDREAAEDCYAAFRYGEERTLAKQAFLTEPWTKQGNGYA